MFLSIMEKYSIIVVQTLDEEGEKNMRQLIDALKEMKGKTADIYTGHKLFGKQHIQMKFVPEIEAGWGFRVHGQAIYIDKDDIVSYEVDDGRIIINGNRMTIKIISRS